MAAARRPKHENRTISFFGLLTLLVGGGILYVVLALEGIYFDLEPRARMVLVSAGIVAAGVGGWSVSSGLRPRQAHGPKRRVLVLRQGVGYLVIMAVLFVGALLGRSNTLMLVFALMAGPFVLNGSITYSMLRRNTISRHAPRNVIAGEPCSVELRLSNRKWLMSTWLMTVRDVVQNETESLSAGVLFARVPPRQSRAATYQLRLMQRGKYRLGPVSLTTRFPLGLVERGLTHDDFTDIIVFPRLGRIVSNFKRELLMATEPVYQREAQRGVFDDDFHSIREYRWGDNPRAIHWRTSARRNQIMIREYRQTRDQNLVVLLDLHAPGKDRDAEWERTELAVSFAATVAVEHMRQSRDAALRIIVAGQELTEWEGRSVPANIEAALEALALVKSADKTDVAGLFERAAKTITSDTRVLFVTTRWEQPDILNGENGRSRAITETLHHTQVVLAEPAELKKIFHLL